MKPVTIEELKKVIAMSELPTEHLNWIRVPGVGVVGELHEMCEL